MHGHGLCAKHFHGAGQEVRRRNPSGKGDEFLIGSDLKISKVPQISADTSSHASPAAREGLKN